MSGNIILLILIVLEISFFIYEYVKGKRKKKIRSYINVGIFFVAFILMLCKIMPIGIRWSLLLCFLFVRALYALITIKKGKHEDHFMISKGVLHLIINCMILIVVCFPAILFKSYVSIETSGDHTYSTRSETWEDISRNESLSKKEENRKVTVQFWYPKDAKDGEKFPLVVFSHGAYGFRGSNQSTCEELASNGYVVCSIDHTYHAFFTRQADGNVIPISTEFLNELNLINSNKISEEENFEITSGWLNLRKGDMNFVVDTIKDNVIKNQKDDVYKEIDIKKIGLFGHSLGGATSAQLGRERDDIISVIDIDGTMSGEINSVENNKVEITKDPYPIPLLNIYAEYHYVESRKIMEQYMNTLSTTNGVDAKETVIWGAQHLNYTDLPLFAPGIAKMLGEMGTGKIEPRYCIKTMNGIILNYFNHYLKGSEELHIEKEYNYH